MSGDYAIPTHMKLFLTYSTIHTQYTRYTFVDKSQKCIFNVKYLEVTNNI